MAIYLFFDEAGNLDFNPSGSKWYVFGVLSTPDPGPLSHALTTLRYELMGEREGLVLERFHASEDRQAVRDRVFESLLNVGDFEYDAVVIEKRKTHWSIQEPLKFYPKFAEVLLQYVFHRHAEDGEPLILVTDQLPLNRKRKSLEKAFRLFMAARLGGRRYSIAHHRSASHAGLQAADYLNWALYKKWEQDDTRSYDIVRSFIKSELDIFADGREYFYDPPKK